MIIDSPTVGLIPSLRRLWREAFGDSEEFLDTFAATAFSADRCRCVCEGGEAVAALYWFDCSYEGGRVAYIYAVATARSHRGRGICRALMEDTHAHLAELGYVGAILVPGSKELFALYTRLGYRTCAYVSELCVKSGDGDIYMRRIDADEYARLRRALLPRGGVVQENENILYLQALSELYAGDGFILSAYGIENTLRGVELLGDASVAPRIVRALGYPEGRFRTVGDDIPFAMYRQLSKDVSATPTYFGLSFD